MNLPEIYEERRAVSQHVEDAPFFQSSDDQITFSYLLAMLRRRLPVLALTMVVCFLLGLLWTLASPQIYRAAADVVLITKQSDVVPGEADFESSGRVRDEDVLTEIQLVSSSGMAAQVFDELDLSNDPGFVADVQQRRSTIDNIKTSLGFGRGALVETPPSPEAFRERAIAYLTRAIEVSRVSGSFNLRFEVYDYEADRAALIANTYARLYTTDDARQRARRNATSAQVLGDRLEELREQANEDFAAVQAYRVNNNLLSNSATALTEGEISTINQQIASARASAAEDAQALASARAQLGSGGAGNVGQGTNSGVVSSLRAQRSQLTTREADLSQRYLDRHPELVTVREQIATIDAQINAEVNREIRSLEARAQSSQQRLSSLLASRDGTRSQLRGDNTALVALADLQRQADASQALYQSYLERFNEVMAGVGAEQPSARLISAASVPGFPSSPNWPLMLALSIAVGAVLGVLLAILSEIAYGGFTTLDDVEGRLALNALGSVPAYKSIKPYSATALETLQDHPDGAFAESLRNILVSIGRAATGRCDVIAITSSIPGEGKSTLSACLGRTIAMADQSVIVVDCDIIRSQMSHMFGLYHGEGGLHDALHNPDGQVAHYTDDLTQMRILPITKPFRKGERLTEKGRLRAVVERLREQYDFVILDCPPILPIAEAREIVAIADHAVLVVRWRKTIEKIVKSAIRQLPRHVLAKTGVALNAVDMRKQVRFGGSDAASFYKHYEAYYG